MSDPRSWDYEEIEEIVDDLSTEFVDQDDLDENIDFLENSDYWRGGDGWIGPGRGDKEALKKVKPQFTADDLLGEAADRHDNALLQNGIDVDFVRKQASDEQDDDQEKEQMSDLIDEWMKNVKFEREASEAVRRSRYAGFGTMRSWITNSVLEEREDGSTIIPKGNIDFKEALMGIRVDAHRVDQAVVYEEPETNNRIGIFLHEVQQLDSGQYVVAPKHKKDDTDIELIDAAEVWFIDPETGNTVMRLVLDNDDSFEFSMPLNGHIGINQMQASILFTEPVRGQQKALNFLSSLLNRVSETAGFPERFIWNAEPNGTWKKERPKDTHVIKTQEQTDPDTGETETLYLHPEKRTLGAATTHELIGILSDIEDSEGTTDKEKIKRATPGVKKFDPTDPEYITKAREYVRSVLLKNVKQGHISTTETGEASGVAYQQHRADFEADLKKVSYDLQDMIKDTLATVIKMASVMSGEFQDFLDKYKIIVSVHISTGPVTADEMQQIAELVSKGVLSRRDAMNKLGIQDIPGALKRLKEDEAYQRTVYQDKLKNAFIPMLQVFGAEVAAQMSDLPEDKIEILRERFGDTPDEVPDVGDTGENPR